MDIITIIMYLSYNFCSKKWKRDKIPENVLQIKDKCYNELHYYLEPNEQFFDLFHNASVVYQFLYYVQRKISETIEILKIII